MYYIIENKNICSADISSINSDHPCFAYLDVQELQEHSKELGFADFEFQYDISSDLDYRTSINVFDNCTIVIINTAAPNVDEYLSDKIAFIIEKNRFYIIKIRDDDNSTMDALENSVSRFNHNATLEKVIFGTLDTLLSVGSNELIKYDNQIMQIEKIIADGKSKQTLNNEIYRLRNRLSGLKLYYEQLVDIGEGLEANENELFCENDLRYLTIFTNKAERLSNNASALNESLIHLREALDAALNYSMNKTMQLFTVVSVIFLPLTLITGWYGMNFDHMPELAWELGYPGVIALSVAIIAVCLIYFKKKKWL